MKKFIILFCFVLNLSADDRIIGWVEDEVITQKELDYALREGVDKNRAIEEMVNLILFQKRAGQLGINISDAMVLERLEEIKGGFASSLLFNSALEDKGMDEALFKKRIKKELAKARLINILKERIKIKEDELLSNFDKWQEEVCVYFLEFKNEKDANRVFLELTKDGTTTERIETTGFFCFPEMQSEFSKIAFALDEGKISHPSKIGEKFYIIKGGEKRKTDDSHLARIRDELFMENRGRIKRKTPNENTEGILAEILSLTEERLKNEKFEEYLKEFLNEIRSSAYIKLKT